MNEKYSIRIEEKIPDTNYFLYKAQQYPFNFDLFKYSSNYFAQRKDISDIKIIPLIDEDININLSDETITSFIKFVQREDILLHEENVLGLHYLSHKYEVETLKKFTNDYIRKNLNNLVIDLLLNSFNEYSLNFPSDSYEKIICENFVKNVTNEKIFALPISVLYRIFLNLYKQKQLYNVTDDEINKFLIKSLEKYGRKASVLFSGIDFRDKTVDMINILLTNYSDIFDFTFIDPNNLKTIFENHKEFQSKEAMLEKENDELKKSIQSIKEELKKMEDQNKHLESVIEELKIVEEEKNKLKNENELIHKKMEEMKKEVESAKENPKNILSFQCTDNNNMNGIFKYLTDMAGGNPHDKHVIDVTSNSIMSPDLHPKNLLDFNPNNRYAPIEKSNDAWVLFDFKNINIEVESYSIKSANYGPNKANLKNWRIEVSNDGENFTTIDNHQNSQELNGAHIIKNFNVLKNGFMRYVRFHHYGDYWGYPNWNMVIVQIEFFGRIEYNK